MSEKFIYIYYIFLWILLIGSFSSTKSHAQKPRHHITLCLIGAETLADTVCHLQEYNPDLTHNLSKKKKGTDGVTLTHVTSSVDQAQTGERGR